MAFFWLWVVIVAYLLIGFSSAVFFGRYTTAFQVDNAERVESEGFWIVTFMWPIGIPIAIGYIIHNHQKDAHRQKKPPLVERLTGKKVSDQ